MFKQYERCNIYTYRLLSSLTASSSINDSDPEMPLRLWLKVWIKVIPNTPRGSQIVDALEIWC